MIRWIGLLCLSPLLGCADRVEYRTVTVPAFLTALPQKPNIDADKATATEAALFIIELNADDEQLRHQLKLIKQYYGEQ